MRFSIHGNSLRLYNWVVIPRKRRISGMGWNQCKKYDLFLYALPGHTGKFHNNWSKIKVGLCLIVMVFFPSKYQSCRYITFTFCPLKPEIVVGGQDYGRKSPIAQTKTMTIRRLLADLSWFDQRGSLPELNLNWNRSHRWAASWPVHASPCTQINVLNFVQC